MLSLALAIFNVLPIPALDGGRFWAVILQKLLRIKDEKFARLKIYEALKKSTEVFGDTFAFNTLIAACMEALNAINAQDNEDVNAEGFFIILNLLEFLTEK